jgi:hypothetical protein
MVDLPSLHMIADDLAQILVLRYSIRREAYSVGLEFTSLVLYHIHARYMDGSECHGSYLPIELVYKVIKFVRDDEECLLACACVHSSWTPAARVHLFRDINLAHLQHWKRLVRMLDQNPLIARYIKHLCIDDYQDNFLQHAVRDKAGPDAASRLGDLLEGVQSLALYGVRIRPNDDPMVSQFIRTKFVGVRRLFLHLVSTSNRSTLQQYVLDPRPAVKMLVIKNVTISNPIGPSVRFMKYPELEVDAISFSMFTSADEAGSVHGSNTHCSNQVQNLGVDRAGVVDFGPMSRALSVIGPSLERLNVRVQERDGLRYPEGDAYMPSSSASTA